VDFLTIALGLDLDLRAPRDAEVRSAISAWNDEFLHDLRKAISKRAIADGSVHLLTAVVRNHEKNSTDQAEIEDCGPRLTALLDRLAAKQKQETRHE
jgi:hypothetical protein